MATYIQGLNDYIPTLQPFSPDYNFLSNILQTRQSRYDAANKQLSGVYGTLLNSPMSRQSNLDKRDAFFKSVDQDIQKISGMDLSLQQNQDVAMNVFKPFYEDKDMVKDMTWTKNWLNEYDRGENFKTCVDPEKCGGQYWEGGIEALQWKRQEFMNASNENALNFANASFTPMVNVTALATKAAKDAGFAVSFDEVKGGYIVTTKNGDRMIAPLASYFTSLFGSDARITSYYKTQAYLERKNWVAQNAGQYGGEDKATMAYMNNMLASAQKTAAANTKDAQEDHDLINSGKNIMEERIRKGGILLSEGDMISGYQNLVTASDASKGNKDYHENASNISNNIDQNIGNYSLVAEKFDELVGLNKLSNDMLSAASGYANLTVEQSLKADPFALQASAHKYAMDELQYQKGWIDPVTKEYHPGVDAASELYINQMKAEQEQQRLNAMFGPDKPTMVPGAPGSGTGPEANKGAAYTENANELNKLYVAADGDKVHFVNSLVTTLVANGKKSGGLSSSTDNLVRIFRAAGFKDPITATKSVLKGGQESVDVMNQLANITSSKVINSVYDASVELSDPSNKVWGMINNDWNKDFWNTNSSQVIDVKNKQYLYDQMAVFSKTQMTNIGAQLKGEYLNAKDNNSATLLDQIVNNTSNGIIPTDNAWKQKQINTWVAANKNSFSPGAPQRILNPNDNTPWTPAEVKGGPRDSRFITGPGKTQEQVAQEWATTNLDKVITNLQSTYMTKGNAWNHADTYGVGSSGDEAMAFQYYADPGAPTRNGTMNLAELLRNYGTAQDNALVGFGNASTKPDASDPKAQAIVNKFMSDYFSNPGKLTPTRAAGNFTFQRVAGNDKNLWAFTINPSASWIAANKGSGTNPGVTAPLTAEGDYANQGITVFMNHADANNSLFNATEYDPYDFIMDRKGYLPMDSYPDAGNLQLTKIGEQYHVQGFINDMQSDGSFTKISIDQPYNVDIEPSVVYNDWNQKLANLQAIIYQQRDYLRSTTGVKDPNQLLTLPTQ
jgi:hypothetical protein